LRASKFAYTCASAQVFSASPADGGLSVAVTSTTLDERMSENLIHRLVPHQGCVITRTAEGIEIAVRELRVHDPASGEQHPVAGKGFISTNAWHEILWEIGLDRMRVVADGEVRFEKQGDYSGFESAPSIGPCFGSTVAVREFSVSPP
jgi:hypothetical protein